ncbi:MAG: imidazolonepropionase [Marinilabiliales bacterium]|nr:imidazolonepropionase [Marinilabiliales bacterium]
MMENKSGLFLTGPFRQLLTMDNLPLKGALPDESLEWIGDAGMVYQNGVILEVGNYKALQRKYDPGHLILQHMAEETVALPGFLDAHTHLIWAGSRANDYAHRLQGMSYTEIAKTGGGIMQTVLQTREASDLYLKDHLKQRLNRQLKNGVTTTEVKSGYALQTEGELRLLRIIAEVNKEHPSDLISTCLAAHVRPRDFDGSPADYLECLVRDLLPQVKRERLSSRVDIFVEEGAFNKTDAARYLKSARAMGFDLVVHGEQFSSGGVSLAIGLGAKSVDHLENIRPSTIKKLAGSSVVALVLPGASMGLGCGYAPARKLLDAGCSVAMASDWNPGSAPMGDLIVQTALLGTAEKLSMAEQLAGITFRAAAALSTPDRGVLRKGMVADFSLFPTGDFREILYHQGQLKPSSVWKDGVRVI